MQQEHCVSVLIESKQLAAVGCALTVECSFILLPRGEWYESGTRVYWVRSMPLLIGITGLDVPIHQRGNGKAA